MTTTLLPPQLRTPEFIAGLQTFTTQWSQLVCWTWVENTAFTSDPEMTQEKELKQYMISMLQKQAQLRLVALEYDAPGAAQEALVTGKQIKDLLAGETIPNSQNPLTLPKVYKQLTGLNNYIFTDMLESEECKSCRIEVTVDSFAGSIRSNEDYGPGDPALYIGTLAYPPRPVYSDSTVTEAQVLTWMKGGSAGDYLPPSVYIPVTT